MLSKQGRYRGKQIEKPHQPYYTINKYENGYVCWISLICENVNKVQLY